jgi:hypothetical protein
MSCVPKNKASCTVLPVSTKQRITTARHEESPQAENRGADGLTLGERLQRCMQVKSRKLGRTYMQKDLLADANRAAGRGPDDEPVITQQGLSLILKNKRFESAATPAFAAALEVEALWLQYGVGPASYLDTLTAKKLG